MRRIALALAALVMGCSEPTGTTAPVESVTIQAATNALPVGSSLPLTVILRDAKGNMLANRTITFASSNESVISVDAKGSVQGLAVGKATVTATSEGKSGQMIVSVNPRGPSPWDY
jgi:Bacterial surface proteins containing Ig-like domains